MYCRGSRFLLFACFRVYFRANGAQGLLRTFRVYGFKSWSFYALRFRGLGFGYFKGFGFVWDIVARGDFWVFWVGLGF